MPEERAEPLLKVFQAGVGKCKGLADIAGPARDAQETQGANGPTRDPQRDPPGGNAGSW